jgi:sugar lactone lactonase YvrE
MFTTFFTSPRRFAGYVLTLLLSSVCLLGDVAAQTPLVVSSSPVAVPHTVTNGAPWQNAVSNHGDFVLFDFKTTVMTEFPGNGGPQITLAAANVIAGGFTDSGIAIDPRNNNIYLNNNYSGGLIEYPYDAATGAWDLPSKVVASGLNGNLGGSCGNYFQSAGLAINDNGVMAVATENGCGVEIFTVPIDASGNFGTVTPIVAGMKMRAKTVAIDDAGNVSYNEDAGGVTGARFVPAGTTGLTSESAVIRIDPNLGNVQGVAVDQGGNVYVADGSAGVYLVPLESGTPNPADAILLTPAPAQGNASIDQVHGILFFPISTWNGFKDVLKVYINRVELGAAAVGSTGATPGTIYYSFSGAVTPHSFVVEEAGSAGDFAVGTGGTCVADTAYAAGSSCTLNVNLTAHSAGDVSAKLVMLDASGNVLATTLLHGVGQGSAILVASGTESTIGSGLQTPSQIATDASGNVYIADSGLGKVLQYAKGSVATTQPVSIGTGLTAPTGVAVDGAGDVFIADSGKVVEIPYGQTGLNAAGQITRKTGLGTHLKLAVDGIGNLFVADPDNQRVANLKRLAIGMSETDIIGLGQLSAIASDGSGDLFLANGQSLIEVSALGVQTTVLNGISAANGLAVDPSGAVYLTSTSGTTIRIPNESGTLNVAHNITLATGVTNPTSVAIDSAGNAYVTDGGAKNVDFINANGFLNLGALTSTTGQQTGSVTIVDDGNRPLNITGFTSTADFSPTENTCIGSPVAVGISCSATITFNPGPGDQGQLSGQILVNSDAANAPIGVNVTGVGAALAASKSTITVTKPTVTNAPVVVSVAPASGTTPVPTGNATLTVTGNGIKPLIITQSLAAGSTTFNPTSLATGSYTFALSYGGDRVYSTSTASTTATVTAGVVMLIQPAPSKVPTYVLAAGQGSQEPTDNSQVPFYYNYPAVVAAANGAPLLGQPVFSASGTLKGYDYGQVTFTLANGTQACAPFPVNADGTTQPEGTQCFGIDTSNNQIPDLMTSYTITPVYSGNTDPNYGTVTGTPVTFIALRNPMVIITSNPASLNVTAGSTATATLTLTSLLGYGVAGLNGRQNVNNYTLPLELECDSLPAHASCIFTYPIPDPSDANSVAVNPTTPGKVLLTINTNVPVGTSTASLRRSPVVFAAMFGFSLLGLAFGKKRNLRSSLLRVICLLLFASAVASVSACSSAQIGSAPILTTPKGTYNITVTAKQAGSRTVPGANPGTTAVVVGNGNQMSIPFTMNVVVQ